MAYTVGEMSKRLGGPASTLRYYDKEGLLPQVERSPGGIRVFQESDYEWLRMIGCMKKAGMSIRDIRHYIQLSAQGGRYHRRPAGDVPEPAGGAVPPDRGDAAHPGNRGVQMLVL